MLDLAGLTPPASVVKSQSTGWSSLLPATKAVSWALGSGEWFTRFAAASPCQSVRDAESVWLPSPPWNVLGGSEPVEGGSGAAAASEERQKTA